MRRRLVYVLCSFAVAAAVSISGCGDSCDENAPLEPPTNCTWETCSFAHDCVFTETETWLNSSGGTIRRWNARETLETVCSPVEGPNARPQMSCEARCRQEAVARGAVGARCNVRADLRENTNPYTLCGYADLCSQPSTRETVWCDVMVDSLYHTSFDGDVDNDGDVDFTPGAREIRALLRPYATNGLMYHYIAPAAACGWQTEVAPGDSREDACQQLCWTLLARSQVDIHYPTLLTNCDAMVPSTEAACMTRARSVAPIPEAPIFSQLACRGDHCCDRLGADACGNLRTSSVRRSVANRVARIPLTVEVPNGRDTSRGQLTLEIEYSAPTCGSSHCPLYIEHFEIVGRDQRFTYADRSGSRTLLLKYLELWQAEPALGARRSDGAIEIAPGSLELRAAGEIADANGAPIGRSDVLRASNRGAIRGTLTSAGRLSISGTVEIEGAPVTFRGSAQSQTRRVQ